jgi:hypothetical protein
MWDFMLFISVGLKKTVLGFSIKFANYHGKSAKYLIAEYYSDRLQSTPLGKLCTDASA